MVETRLGDRLTLDRVLDNLVLKQKRSGDVFRVGEAVLVAEFRNVVLEVLPADDEVELVFGAGQVICGRERVPDLQVNVPRLRSTDGKYTPMPQLGCVPPVEGA